MNFQHLPLQAIPLIGRAAELAQHSHLLLDTECRLLTLTGAGGIGKTRLAIEIAQQVGDYFRDGVYFIPLLAVENSDALIFTIADALSLQLHAGLYPEGQLLSFLHKKNVLLVLDGFDHLTAIAETLTHLLEHAPRLKFIVTSREVLHLQEEWVRVVLPLTLPMPTPEYTAPIVAQSEAPFTLVSAPYINEESASSIALFLYHARRLRGDAAIRQIEPAAARIAQLCEGNPLALELAAGWLKTLPIETIAANIQNNVDFLAAQTRNMPEPHRNFRTVFETSWQQLTPEEQAAIWRLAVFETSFTVDAAQQVADVKLPMLSTLVAKSLLMVQPGGRYGLSGLLRPYANEKCEQAGSAEALRTAHSSYYIAFWQRRENALYRSAPLRAEITAELDNLRAAFAHATAKTDTLRLNGTLEGFRRFCALVARTRSRDTTELPALLPETPAEMNESAPLSEPLSQREIEVLSLLAAGCSNTEIADTLVIGMSTVKKHINHIFKKLTVTSRVQAILRSRELNLV
jgi:predicted ATPase/DNA-binding CsgD family transcriptional regulator